MLAGADERGDRRRSKGAVGGIRQAGRDMGDTSRGQSRKGVCIEVAGKGGAGERVI